MTEKGPLIFADYVVTDELKKGNLLVWFSLIFLSLVFLPFIGMFFYYAVWGTYPDQSAPVASFIRMFLAACILFIINIILCAGFPKPVKIYQNGISLGTVGSLGPMKAFLCAFILYFKPAVFVPWEDVQTIEKTQNELLKVTRSDTREFYCSLAEHAQSKSYTNIIKAIEKAGQSDKISH